MLSFIKNHINKITNKIKLFFKPKKVDVKISKKEKFLKELLFDYEKALKLINEGKKYEFYDNRIHFDERYLKDLKMSAKFYNSFIFARPKLSNFDIIEKHNSELNLNNPTKELLIYRDKLNSDLKLKVNYLNKKRYDKIINDMNKNKIEQ